MRNTKAKKWTHNMLLNHLSSGNFPKTEIFYKEKETETDKKIRSEIDLAIKEEIKKIKKREGIK